MTSIRRIIAVLVVAIGAAAWTHAADKHEPPQFRRLPLEPKFYAEGATLSDVNRDGHADVVAGPFWYAGPEFRERREIYPPRPFDVDGYAENFFAFAHDVDGDKWQDVLVVGFPGKQAFWYRNPAGKARHWQRYLAYANVDNESPTFTDLTGDGRPELVLNSVGKLGYAEIPSDDPTKSWQFHAISDDRGYVQFTHGLGVGDVNGDGRTDVLEKNGWWEQPAASHAKVPNIKPWKFHHVPFAPEAGGAQMLVFDVDGDGDNDVVTSKNAHGYGLAWFEQMSEKRESSDELVFVEHLIMGQRAEENDYGVAFSQLHALALADVNGDGIQDIVTGKRYWAHQDHDPGSLEPAVLYWFETVRKDSGAHFVPHHIDDDSGVGTQVVVGQASGDKRPDVLVSNKKGTFVFVQDQAKTAPPPQVKQPGAQDEYLLANVSAEQAVAAIELPDGFSVKVFAAEPDVRQPIALALDDRGRLWIAEAYEYPNRAAGDKGRDRILIFADADGDGRFDERKVFADGLNLVSGLEVGFGGVWVGAAPYLLFIPDRNGDDIPDGEPEKLLDGWGWQDTHETLNTFIWGPDGWLYGCHGVFTHSRVGKPGTPDNERVPLNAAIWRYHPTRHKFEVFSEGTSNPWGVDFNDWGQAISTACVIPHLFHNIQGARYQRQAGEHFNRHTYDDIKTIADHLHYLGEWAHAGNGKSDSVGGGHAHAGAMIYLGDAWPAQYRNQVFMNNIHGQRLNMDVLKPRGSGYVGAHGPDFLLTGDMASQMLNFRYGPDGQVYVIDWYDMQACHVPQADAHDRSNGRIYKILYGDVNAKSPAVDLRSSSDSELVELTLRQNDWFVRHARRILQERAAEREINAAALVRMREIANRHLDETRRLRAIWALHATGQLTNEMLTAKMQDADEYVRGWAIQLTLDGESVDRKKWLPELAALAESDPSPVVRLYLASALQQLVPEDRWEVLSHLTRHVEDAGDHNLSLMYWYAAEPLAEVHPTRALALGLSCGKTIPRLREFMVRRLASIDSPVVMAALVDELAKSNDTDEQLAILEGIRQALQGQRRVDVPANWSSAYRHATASSSQAVRDAATGLGVTFGDAAAMQSLRNLVASPAARADARRAALDSLLAAKDSQLPNVLQELLSDSALRDLAILGLAQYDDPQTPSLLLDEYPTFSPTEKRAALATLCARPAYGLVLLDAVAAKQIAAADLPADLVRQLKNHKNAEIDKLLSEVWGTIRTTPEDKAKLIADLKQLLAASDVSPPDPMLGRAVFVKTCGQCHALYGVGAKIGPDLTGSNRGEVDYLVSNIVDPGALMAKEYQPTVVITMDGRVVTGIVTKEDDNSITIQTATEAVVIPVDEIDERELSEVSMMPDDQLKQFNDHETRSLFAYLMGKSQVPLLATPENAGSLFNGRDLAGWSGDTELWAVENGEFVGRSPGLTHNSFLISDLLAGDFELSFDVKLVDNVGNSGIQFRSRPLNGYNEIQGYQADAGPGWWGKLYEENGRALLWEKSGDEFVKSGEWNHYEIRAVGSHVQTWINGHPCVDLVDADGAHRGQFALQIHAGSPMEVRFRNLVLELIDETSSN